MAYSHIKDIVPFPLALILMIAIMIRLIGISYGFPLFLVNDEPSLVLGSLKMIELNTLIPAFHEDEFKKVLYYPPFASYLYLLLLLPVFAFHYALLGFPGPSAYADHIALDPSVIWIAARFVNVLFGLLVIVFVYHIARRVTGSNRASSLAALFLSLSFFHIQVSQVVRHWMLASVFIYASWLAATFFEERKKQPQLLAGLFAGLAAGVNTSGLIALLPGFIAHLKTRSTPLLQSVLSKRFFFMIGCAAVILAISIALYPYGFTRGEGASSVGGDLASRFLVLRTKSIPEWLVFLFDYSKLLFRYEITLVVASLIGAYTLFKKNVSFVITVFVFSISYLTLLYLFFNEIPRALVFLLPAFAVCAGYGTDRMFGWVEKKISFTEVSRTLALLFVGFLLFAYPFLFALRYDYLFSRSDTRLVATEWVKDHVPAGSKILMDSQYMRLTNTKEGIQELIEIDDSALRSSDRALSRASLEQYPEPAFHVLNLALLNQYTPERTIRDAEYFRTAGFQYLIIAYSRTDMSDVDHRTRDLLVGLSLIKRITPFKKGVTMLSSIDASGEIASIGFRDFFKLERFGEIVDVYDLSLKIPSIAVLP